MTKPHLVIGIDVGGTFTDLFFLDEITGYCDIAKVPSRRGNEADGILDGIGKRVPDLSTIATIVHGTTVGTNALLERAGGKIGVITTAGFRDVLEMRRRDRPMTWGLTGHFDPVVPRDLRIEVAERVLADGTILEPVDIGAVEVAARQLLDQGVEAVALTFINSYANPANEQAAAQAVRKMWPNSWITASSDILPEIREFERSSTAALNAYLQPVVTRYLTRLETGLRTRGFAGELLIVQSNGGVMTVQTACELPVRTALSGPAAGVIASAHIAGSAGADKVITCDMGGTSFDVSIIVDGLAPLAAQTSIDFGMVVRTPMIEITTIGAGGGSIAWVDDGGLLQIGPESAGSVPGPVCYGQGNDRPTVTDANVVLGRINAERPIGGALTRLDVEAARTALLRHVGTPLGLDAVAAADAVIRVANARMAGALRLVSIERGHDPREFVAMPFGGGGSLHAGALIKEMGMKGALVPRYPGVTSALGCVIADMRHDFVVTLNRMLDDLDETIVAERVGAMVANGKERLARASIEFGQIDVDVEFDMSYLGQTHTISVGIGTAEPSQKALQDAFIASYSRAYGRVLTGGRIRVLNLRVAVIGRRPKLDLAVLAPDAKHTSSMPTGRRAVYFEGDWQDTAIYDRLSLAVGTVLNGPAILEQSDTTILIGPAQRATVDHLGNIFIEAHL